VGARNKQVLVDGQNQKNGIIKRKDKVKSVAVLLEGKSKDEQQPNGFKDAQQSITIGHRARSTE
jgi:hypothetical protein